MIGELSIAIPLAIICVLGSAFCSGTEVALFSLRRVDREQLARSERGVDKHIVKLLERPRRLIATVLIGNEAFNSVLAILCLAVVWRNCDTNLWAIGGLALAICLPLVVLIAEVTSKTLAAKAPLTWSRVCVLPLALFAFLVTPIRVVIGAITSVVLAPFGDSVRNRPARDLAEQEFRTLVDAGAAQGQVDARERRLIHRVFEFSDKNVGQVMTPREKMFALNYDLPMARLLKEVAARGFSRVPIYKKSIDNISGILNAKDLVAASTGKPLGKPLGEVLHEPLFVPRTTPVKRLFLTFKQKKVHIAVVVSEYGKVLGIVTMDDLLAQIFGRIQDERAEMQSAMPNATGMPGGKTRTPAPGVVRPNTDPPVAFSDQSVPVSKLDGSDLSGPAQVASALADASVETAAMSGAIDIASMPILPIHPVDEVTPPAVDIEELQRDQEKKSS